MFRFLIPAMISVLVACAPPPAPRMAPPPPANEPAEAVKVPDGMSTDAAPTVEQARAFIDGAEKKLLQLWIAAERASWVKMTYITQDTAIIAAKAYEHLMAFVSKTASEATRYDKLQLPDDMARKLKLLKLSLSLPAPSDPKKRAELATIATHLDSIYGKGKVCSKALVKAYRRIKRGFKPPADSCLTLGQVSDILAKSRNYDHLLEAWTKWRLISRPMRPLYSRYVQLANAGARDLGFADLGTLWRSRYDMPASAFSTEVDRLWKQLQPLYEQLHCYTRARLQKRYGKSKVADGKPIPAHLLGNMWAQDWSYIKEMLLPEPRAGGINLERALRRKKVDEEEMVRYGERFFVSLGMDKLPATFWKRSMFRKPADREVVCHASAWDVDYVDDLRIKMCIKINDEDFSTVHHELGHNYYQYYYRQQPTLFRDSANDGFHEGIGDTISLSVTPSYLVKIGLLRKAPKSDLNALMERALEKIAFLPFGLLIDRWRWEVFSKKISPDKFNASWWEMRQRYQGIAPPVGRSEEDFDPGAKYHIPANVPYTRYFLAAVLQFQFHRALCKISGHSGPLHTCSIYGNKVAGERLKKMLAMGLSRPWPEALAALSGETKMDASAILTYFEPLTAWLKKQNEGQQCGW